MINLNLNQQTKETKQQAFKNQAKKMIEYAKQNPTDVLLGCLTLIMMDANASIDSIEQLEQIENSRN